MPYRFSPKADPASRSFALEDGLGAFANLNVLLLQGPIGPFFKRFARDLDAAGARVTKVSFCAGDRLYLGRDALPFRGSIQTWPEFFEQIILNRAIDFVFLFGDCRAHHKLAIQIARKLGVRVLVFEEGYVRPNYVTLEPDGVNGFSALSRNPADYAKLEDRELDNEHDIRSPMFIMVVWGFFYYLFTSVLFWRYPHYQHHRAMHLLEALPWVKSWFARWYYKWKERHELRALTDENAPPFFLVPLQVFNDAQILIHSREGSVDAFIDRVMTSFAEHAPADTHLVIKHHPFDRGYLSYTKRIRKNARTLGLKDRVHYVHDQHLPTLLRRAQGVVTVNSTVGMSALIHECPVITTGRAFYDMEGLCFQGTLDGFWAAASDFTVDMRLFRIFRSELIRTTQINGNFYRKLPNTALRSGLVWPTKKAEAFPTLIASRAKI